MADVSPGKRTIDILINGICPENKLSYVIQQALAENEVIHCFEIRNDVLLRWQALDCPTKNYVDLLNDIIPNSAIRIKRSSVRVSRRLQLQCHRAKQKLQKLNKGGSKRKRASFLKEHTKLSVLVSDVMTAAEYERETSRVQEEMEQLMERTESLINEVGEWRRRYADLEREKEMLYEEMVAEQEALKQKRRTWKGTS